MAVTVHGHQVTEHKCQGCLAKAMMSSGMIKRRKKAKKWRRSRLEASPIITRRRPCIESDGDKGMDGTRLLRTSEKCATAIDSNYRKSTPSYANEAMEA
jgi:hypothetical protein